MSDFLSSLAPDVPLPPGVYGAAQSSGIPAGVTATALDLALAHLGAGRGLCGALVQQIATGLGITLPVGPGAVCVGAITFIATRPGGWLVTAEDGDGEALETRLAGLAGDAGSVCDQSDGTLVYELKGADVRAALAKMVDIDLDPAVFGPGSAATTRGSLIGMTLWITLTGTVRVAVARSYGAAFLRALSSAAAEYGFVLT